MFRKKVLLTVALPVAIGLWGVSAAAQDAQLVQAPASLQPSPSAHLAFPGVFGAPSAVAARSKSGFVGATYANPRGGVSGSGGDGDIVAGYSFGNPLDAVSLTFAVALTGIDPLGDAGSFSLSASRLLRAGGNSATFVGFSTSNVLPWGVNKGRPEMYSLYLSHLVGFDMAGREVPVQITVGYGTDSTRDSAGLGALSDGAFVGVGVGLTQYLSGSVSATQTQLNVGMTYSIADTGISLSVGGMDVTNNTDRRQVSLSVGIGF
jgi:hypothetical protein